MKPSLLDLLISLLDFMGLVGGHLHHLLRQSLGYQLIRMMLGNQPAIGFLDFCICSFIDLRG